MNIAEKADRLFAARGIKSQAEFAKTIGVGEVTLYNTFRKGSEPRVNTALAIARGLGVSVEWLFDDAADWPPPDALEVQRPPLPIAPWPPHGITWPEVQRAISEYVMRRLDDGMTTGAPKPPKPPRPPTPMSQTMERALKQVEDSMAMRAAADELADLMHRLRAMADAMPPAESTEQPTSGRSRSKKAARKA